LPYPHQGQATVPIHVCPAFSPSLPHPSTTSRHGRKTKKTEFFPSQWKRLRECLWFKLCATLNAKLFCKIKCYWVCFQVECSWGPLAILPILSQMLPVACCCLLPMSTAVGSQGSHRLQVLLVKPEPINLPAECLEPQPTA
jgi:hypothetical protein